MMIMKQKPKAILDMGNYLTYIWDKQNLLCRMDAYSLLRKKRLNVRFAVIVVLYASLTRAVPHT